MLLPRRHQNVNWFASCVDQRVDLAGHASARSSYAVFFGPSVPPDESWWARTTDPSRIPATSSSFRQSVLNMLSHLSVLDQLRNRLYIVFQLPNRSGRSRQGAPVFAIHRTALTKFRSPCFDGLPDPTWITNGLILFHCSSVSSWRRISMLRSEAGLRHNTLP